jgi:hypothetical protein
VAASSELDPGLQLSDATIVADVGMIFNVNKRAMKSAPDRMVLGGGLANPRVIYYWDHKPGARSSIHDKSMTDAGQMLASYLASYFDDRTSVHIGVRRERTQDIESAAAQRGLRYLAIRFPTSVTADDLFEILATELMFPNTPINTQGGLDWLGDLSWLTAERGYVLVLDGLDDLKRADYPSFRALIDMLPFATDQHRSAGHAFHVFLIGPEDQLVAAERFDLDDANGVLEEDDNEINPSEPVRIIDHRHLDA